MFLALRETTRSQLNRIKDDPDDDEDIDITDWIPDLENMIARQQADPSLVSPFGGLQEDGVGVEPGSPTALTAASAPQVAFDVADPARLSVSSAGGGYDLGELPQPPPMTATSAAGSALPVAAPAVGAARTHPEVRYKCCAAAHPLFAAIQMQPLQPHLCN
eukprot:COSAG02_NODE_684_length_18490_cov_14.283019_11_plen_161_part_00